MQIKTLRGNTKKRIFSFVAFDPRDDKALTKNTAKGCYGEKLTSLNQCLVSISDIATLWQPSRHGASAHRGITVTRPHRVKQCGRSKVRGQGDDVTEAAGGWWTEARGGPSPGSHSNTDFSVLCSLPVGTQQGTRRPLMTLNSTQWLPLSKLDWLGWIGSRGKTWESALWPWKDLKGKKKKQKKNGQQVSKTV